jgi:hypothetical protein
MLDNYANACEGKVQYPNKQWAVDASKNIQISNENRVKYGIADHTGYKGVKH